MNPFGKVAAPESDEALAQGITINGLAILSDVPLPFNPQHTHPHGGLLKYYEDNVIGGPGAFALAVDTHEAFPASVLSKLIKEIAGPIDRDKVGCHRAGNDPIRGSRVQALLGMGPFIES